MGIGLMQPPAVGSTPHAGLSDFFLKRIKKKKKTHEVLTFRRSLGSISLILTIPLSSMVVMRSTISFIKPI